jgi:hypothetical protein
MKSSETPKFKSTNNYLVDSKLHRFNIDCFDSKNIDIGYLEKQYVSSDDDIKNQYNPFLLDEIQLYNPCYELFFQLTETNYNTIALNHKYHILDLLNVIDQETREPIEKKIHIKYSPLLDPLKYMIGKYKNYDNINNLPSIGGSSSHMKLLDANNASYVDNFFSFLSSRLLHSHGFLHSVDYYGSYLGVQTKFKMNVIDDLEYLLNSDYFKDNVNKMFSIADIEVDEFSNFGSRSNKQKLIIEDNIDILNDIENLEINIIDNIEENIESLNEVVYEKPVKNTSQSSSSSGEDYGEDSEDDSEDNDDCQDNDDSEDHDDNEEDGDGEDDHASSSHSSENNSDSIGIDEDIDCDDEWETESDETTSNMEEARYVYINNFPVQLICLEKCEGTMDELFEKDKMDLKTAASALFQIVMILLTYQKAFHFTHNDLHTNNIMYIETNIEYLYYKYKNTIYKVPTYGKLFKLIDFGRSIYRFQNKLFCSDSFANGGDAATQYNCEPYMNEKKPRIDPNYSFDLCRLGCSIYDFIIEDEKSQDGFDELQKTISRWCTDDKGKNVLYMSNGEERYPDFKLYKMIARTVHKHTPENQLEYPFFKQFMVKTKDIVLDDVDVIDVDVMPCYV